MSSILPDWLKPTAEDTPATGHLRVLRELLGRDYLSRADWVYALEDLARLAQEALGADKTLVAWGQLMGGWSAVTSDGRRLGDERPARSA